MKRLISPGLPSEEREQLVRALQCLSDPRCLAPLEMLIQDSGADKEVRRAGIRILCYSDRATFDRPESLIRGWWAAGDEVVREYALRKSDWYCCADIVRSVAMAKDDPLHWVAIDQLAWGFPDCQELKIEALAHSDPKVRTAGAESLLWDQPLAAEIPLRKALKDQATEVAIEAARSLEYFPTRGVILDLAEYQDHAEGEGSEIAESSLGGIRGNVYCALLMSGERGRKRILAWAEEVREILGDDALVLEGEESNAGGGRGKRKESGTGDVQELLEAIANLDFSARDRWELWKRVDWSLVSASDQEKYRRLVLDHPDEEVREQAAQAFATLMDAGSLRILASDPIFGVRKSAMYWLGEMPEDCSIGELALERLHSSEGKSTHGMELIRTMAKHADRQLALVELVAIVRSESVEDDLCAEAVNALKRLGGAEELRSVSELLEEGPRITWSLHQSLVRALLELGLPIPDLGHLEGVDDLQAQEILGRVEDGCLESG